MRNCEGIARAYIDDILIKTELQGSLEATVAQHERDVRRVLEALREHKMVADTKTKWFRPKIEFCGHILGQNEMIPAPGKLMALEKWEIPTNITALRGFLGFTNYFASYIPNYGETVAPLMELLKVGRTLGKKG